MITQEPFSLDDMFVAWDPEQRLVLWSAVSPCDVKAEWGRPYCDFLARNTAGGGPYRVLADAHNVRQVHPEFRRVLTDHYSKDRGRVRIAVHNASTIIRVMLYFMALAAGIEGRA